MIVRNDILPSTTTIPRSLQQSILRAGGKNPFGESMFRLLLAECRTVKAAGAWKIWREGLSLEERSGLGMKQIQKMLKEGRSTGEINEFVNSKINASPERIVEGMVERPLYNCKGFILEKWKPAITFGSPEEWYAYRFQGEAALGPYPTYGDYELCAGPTPYMPSAAECEDAIKRTFQEIENRPSTASGRLAQMMQAQDAQEKAIDKENFSNIENSLKEDKALYKTISLPAGRARTELADKAGIPRTEHVGN